MKLSTAYICFPTLNALLVEVLHFQIHGFSMNSGVMFEVVFKMEVRIMSKLVTGILHVSAFFRDDGWEIFEFEDVKRVSYVLI